MGVYSTQSITRFEALRLIEARISKASNKELGDILFALFSNATLSNYEVVDHADEAVCDMADVDRLEELIDDDGWVNG